ncbi:MAG TPA: hypothetical protein VGE90_08440 [Chitinophaga sp.]
MRYLFSLILIALYLQPAAGQTLFAANTVLADYSISTGKIKLLPAKKVMSPLTIGTDYLVTHNEIIQKLSEGYFIKKAGVTVTADNLCLTVAEAKAWLTLDETKLPTTGRMPVWQELVPTAQCIGTTKKVINGVCETAQQIWTRSEWDATNHWYRCYYVYRWSDGSQTAEDYVINGAGCI